MSHGRADPPDHLPVGRQVGQVSGWSLFDEMSAFGAMALCAI